MNMQLFYTTSIRDNIAFLDRNDSTHCIRVLRKKKGDLIRFTDGNGLLYSGEIFEEDPVKCGLKLIEEPMMLEKHNYNLHLAIAPTKNSDRFEWFVEKAVEIGIDEITPVICKHSERKNIKSDRIMKIMISAMKQSLKTHLPVLNELVSLDDFIRAEHSGAEKYIAYLEENERMALINVGRSPGNWIVIIGPEGDFHPEEVQLAYKKGYKAVSLGNSRLRTETAGVAACQVVADLSMLDHM